MSRKSFDEHLLSGYLDGALPQAEAQRVRIHLENDPESRALYEEMRSLRQVTTSTRFKTPPDDRWPELPRTLPSRLGRPAGWMAIIAWLAVTGGMALWHLFTSTGNPFEIFLVLGIPGGMALLFLSVLSDRLRELKTDRYRGVQR